MDTRHVALYPSRLIQAASLTLAVMCVTLMVVYLVLNHSPMADKVVIHAPRWIGKQVASTLSSDANYRYPQVFESLSKKEQDIIQQNFKERVAAKFKAPFSCVFNCSSIPRILLHLPEGTTCDPNKMCSYTGLFPFHYDPKQYVRFQKESKVSCEQNGTLAVCGFPLQDDCDDHGWREWVFHYSQNAKADFTTRFYTAQFLPARPFMINNMFETNEFPSHWKVITFFQPANLKPNRCNQMYCFYEYENGVIERHNAIHGDMSFVYCPKPKESILKSGHSSNSSVSSIILRLSYDHKIFSHPFEIVIDQTMENRLPKVFMTICVIVRREGINLKEWVAFHFMMGYDRIILYDNNQPGFVDEEMERWIRAFPDRIIRYRWPFPHAQTEQCTDCITRFGPTTTWMSYIDVDEFLVPSPPHNDIRSLLSTKYANESILEASWVVFGPCGTEKKDDGVLTMERCKKIYSFPFLLHKATFKPALVAGMQAYGPHFPRLKSDIGKRERSAYRLVNEDMRTYHYRYRTLPEFLERRMGDAADRIIVQDEGSLMRDWSRAAKKSYNMPDSENHMLRFVPALKQAMAKYNL